MNFPNKKLYKDIQIVLPSLKISGGSAEALKLVHNFELEGANVGAILLWKSQNDLSVIPPYLHNLSNWRTYPYLAIFQLPILMWRFKKLVNSNQINKSKYFFTHYSTLPLALLVPGKHRWIFVQGLEWEFLNNKFFSKLLKLFIVWIYSRSNLLAANPYLSNALSEQGLIVHKSKYIWADPLYLYYAEIEREIDLLMLLRKGDCKRLDLYLQAIDWLKKREPKLRIAVITTEDDIIDLVIDKVDEYYVKLNGPYAMRTIYSRAKIFLHLSEHEGFGLPPLEAMGSGCVAICRNSGGPQNYMKPPFDEFLFPLVYPIESIFEQVISILNNQNQWKIMSDAGREIFKLGLDLSFQGISISEL